MSKKKIPARANKDVHRFQPPVALERLIQALGRGGNGLLGPGEVRSWQAALRAAGPAADEILAKHGAVSANDGFFACVTRIADAGWKYSELEGDWNELVDQLVPAPTNITICDDANAVEQAKWQGGYALGLAVGVLLAGGAR